MWSEWDSQVSQFLFNSDINLLLQSKLFLYHCPTMLCFVLFLRYLEKRKAKGHLQTNNEFHRKLQFMDVREKQSY